MIQIFYKTRSFDRQLDMLRTSGEKGVLAADRAERIITLLLRHAGVETDELRSKRTKFGELRLKNCRKYDLGSGYRLITMTRKNKLFMLYAGTHDECDRWLYHKRKDKLQVEPERLIVITKKGEVKSQQVLADFWPDEEGDEYEEQLTTKLSDAELRDIFKGICQK